MGTKVSVTHLWMIVLVVMGTIPASYSLDLTWPAVDGYAAVVQWNGAVDGVGVSTVCSTDILQYDDADTGLLRIDLSTVAAGTYPVLSSDDSCVSTDETGLIVTIQDDILTADAALDSSYATTNGLSVAPEWTVTLTGNVAVNEYVAWIPAHADCITKEGLNMGVVYAVDIGKTLTIKPGDVIERFGYEGKLCYCGTTLCENDDEASETGVALHINPVEPVVDIGTLTPLDIEMIPGLYPMRSSPYDGTRDGRTLHWHEDGVGCGATEHTFDENTDYHWDSVNLTPPDGNADGLCYEVPGLAQTDIYSGIITSDDPITGLSSTDDAATELTALPASNEVTVWTIPAVADSLFYAIVPYTVDCEDSDQVTTYGDVTSTSNGNGQLTFDLQVIDARLAKVCACDDSSCTTGEETAVPPLELVVEQLLALPTLDGQVLSFDGTVADGTSLSLMDSASDCSDASGGVELTITEAFNMKATFDLAAYSLSARSVRQVCHCPHGINKPCQQTGITLEVQPDVVGLQRDGYDIQSLPVGSDLELVALSGTGSTLDNDDILALMKSSQSCSRGSDLGTSFQGTITGGDTFTLDLSSADPGEYRLCFCDGTSCVSSGDAQETGLFFMIQDDVTDIYINEIPYFNYGVAPVHSKVKIRLSGSTTAGDDDEFSLVDNTVSCSDMDALAAGGPNTVQTGILSVGSTADGAFFDLSFLNAQSYKVCFSRDGYRNAWTETGIIINLRDVVQTITIDNIPFDSWGYAPNAADITVFLQGQDYGGSKRFSLIEHTFTCDVSAQSAQADDFSGETVHVEANGGVKLDFTLQSAGAYRVCRIASNVGYETGIKLTLQDDVTTMYINDLEVFANSGMAPTATDVLVRVAGSNVANSDDYVAFIDINEDCFDESAVEAAPDTIRTSDFGGHESGTGVRVDFDTLLDGVQYKLCFSANGHADWIETGLTLFVQNHVTSILINSMDFTTRSTSPAFNPVSIIVDGDRVADGNDRARLLHESLDCVSDAETVGTGGIVSSEFTASSTGNGGDLSSSNLDEGLYRYCFSENGGGTWIETGITVYVHHGPTSVIVNELPVPSGQYWATGPEVPIVHYEFGYVLADPLSANEKVSIVDIDDDCTSSTDFNAGLVQTIAIAGESYQENFDSAFSPGDYKVCYKVGSVSVETGARLTIADPGITDVVVDFVSVGGDGPYQDETFSNIAPTFTTVILDFTGEGINDGDLISVVAQESNCQDELTFSLSSSRTYTVTGGSLSSQEFHANYPDAFDPAETAQWISSGLKKICYAPLGADFQETGLSINVNTPGEITLVSPDVVAANSGGVTFNVEGTSLTNHFQLLIDPDCATTGSAGEHITVATETEASVTLATSDEGLYQVCYRWGGAAEWIVLSILDVRSPVIESISPSENPSQFSSAIFTVTGKALEGSFFVSLQPDGTDCASLSVSGSVVTLDPESDFKSGTVSMSTSDPGTYTVCWKPAGEVWRDIGDGTTVTVVDPIVTSISPLEIPDETSPIEFVAISGRGLIDDVKIALALPAGENCESHTGSSWNLVTEDYTTASATVTFTGGYEPGFYNPCYRRSSSDPWSKIGNTPVEVSGPLITIISPTTVVSAVPQTFEVTGKRMVDDMEIAFVEESTLCAGYTGSGKLVVRDTDSLTSGSVAFTATPTLGSYRVCFRRGSEGAFSNVALMSTSRLEVIEPELTAITPTTAVSWVDGESFFVTGTNLADDMTIVVWFTDGSCGVGQNIGTSTVTIEAGKTTEGTFTMNTKRAGDFTICYRRGSDPLKTLTDEEGSTVLVSVQDPEILSAAPNGVPVQLVDAQLTLLGTNFIDGEIEVALFPPFNECTDTSYTPVEAFRGTMSAANAATGYVEMNTPNFAGDWNICYKRASNTDQPGYIAVADAATATLSVAESEATTLSPLVMATGSEFEFTVTGNSMTQFLELSTTAGEVSCGEEAAYTSVGFLTVSSTLGESATVNILLSPTDATATPIRFGTNGFITFTTPTTEGFYKVCQRVVSQYGDQGEWTNVGSGTVLEVAPGRPMSSAVFSSTGESIVLTFIGDVDPLLSASKVPCSNFIEAVDDPDGTQLLGAECIGGSGIYSTTMTVTLSPTLSTIKAGDAIRVKTNTIPVAESSLYMIGQGNVAAPEDASVPDINVIAPSTFALCTTAITLDASSTFDILNRVRSPAVDFSYSMVSEDGYTFVADIAAALDTETSDIVEVDLSALSLTAASSILIGIDVTATNFVGGIATERIELVADEFLPTVSRNAPFDQTIRLGESPFPEVEMSVTAEYECNSVPIAYEWRQTEGPEVVMISPNSAGLAISETEFAVGEAYEFVVNVCVSDVCVDSRPFTVTVELADIVLSLVSADKIVTVGDTFRLDASKSSDPNGGSPSYAWECTDTTNVVDVSSSAISAVNDESSIVDVTLVSPTTYKCTVEMESSGQLKRASMTVQVTAAQIQQIEINPSYIASREISFDKDSVLTSYPIKLTASGSNTQSYIWTITPVGGDPIDTSSWDNLVTAGSNMIYNEAHTKYIPSDYLTADQYEIHIKEAVPQLDVAGEAAFTLTIHKRPTDGIITVESKGKLKYDIETSLWQSEDVDTVFQYIFFYVNAGGEEVKLCSGESSHCRGATFPPRDITVGVHAYDRLGAFGTATAVVQVSTDFTQQDVTEITENIYTDLATTVSVEDDHALPGIVEEVIAWTDEVGAGSDPIDERDAVVGAIETLPTETSFDFDEVVRLFKKTMSTDSLWDNDDVLIDVLKDDKVGDPEPEKLKDLDQLSVLAKSLVNNPQRKKMSDTTASNLLTGVSLLVRRLLETDDERRRLQDDASTDSSTSADADAATEVPSSWQIHESVIDDVIAMLDAIIGDLLDNEVQQMIVDPSSYAMVGTLFEGLSLPASTLTVSEPGFVRKVVQSRRRKLQDDTSTDSSTAITVGSVDDILIDSSDASFVATITYPENIAMLDSDGGVVSSDNVDVITSSLVWRDDPHSIIGTSPDTSVITVSTRSLSDNVAAVSATTNLQLEMLTTTDQVGECRRWDQNSYTWGTIGVATSTSDNGNIVCSVPFTNTRLDLAVFIEEGATVIDTPQNIVTEEEEFPAYIAWLEDLGLDEDMTTVVFAGICVAGAALLVLTIVGGRRVYNKNQELRGAQVEVYRTEDLEAIAPASAASLNKLTLVFHPDQSKKSGETIQVTEAGLTIGKHERNQLCLPYEEISTFHAHIFFDDGVFFVKDCGSTNGTRVNGRLLDSDVPEVRIKQGDVILCGNRQLTVKNIASGGSKKQSKAAKSIVSSDPSMYSGGAAGRAAGKLILKPIEVSSNAEEWKPAESYTVMDQGFSLGRSRDNDVVLPFTDVSKYHASISFEENRFWLSDGGSANGTYVNGIRLSETLQRSEPVELQVGDVVKVARWKFKVDNIILDKPKGGASKFGAGGRSQTRVTSSRHDEFSDDSASDASSFSDSASDISGGRRGKDDGTITWNVGAQANVGRSHRNQVCIPSADVSTYHATITLESVGYALVDSKSTNGTFINGRKCEPMKENILKTGDVISFGDSKVKVTGIHTRSQGDSRDNLALLFKGTGAKGAKVPAGKTMKTISPEKGKGKGKEKEKGKGKEKEDKKAMKREKTMKMDRDDPVSAGESESDGGDEEIVYVTHSGITVGRSKRNDLCLPYAQVSQSHAEIEFRNSTFFVQDKGSTNGTLVNGTLVTEPTAVRTGDKIEFGNTIVTVMEDNHYQLKLSVLRN